ncbi:hypothetical protein [Metasolibacillus meyeri]|uniref:hypothetical protein n=1 Tax=Metasolibacillus meyeri TaxID=1071052 RepID=UPI000D319E3F|nr:hypothetical protein [Metasolibacillus meyeri]
MNEKQKEQLIKLMRMPVGTTLQKGNRKRILLGLSPGFIIYTTPSKPKGRTMENIASFMKWAEGAEVIY